MCCLRRTYRAEPSKRRLCVELGLVYVARKRYEEAVGQYRKAIKLGLDTAEIHVSLGDAYMGLNKPDEALTEFATATRYAPELGTAFMEPDKPMQLRRILTRLLASMRKH